MNSANEAIYFGVPVVAVPQNSDQPLIAKRLEELELGKFLDKNDVSPDTLRNAVNEVLNNPLYKKNMDLMKEDMRNCGGYKKAVDEIENYIK